MPRLGAKVSRSEVSSILQNTFSIGIFWKNRPHTSFLGLIRNMVRSGAKLFRTKICSILPQKPSRIRFSKKDVFGLNFCTKSHLTYFLGQTDLMARLGAKVSRSEASSILQKTFSIGIFWKNRPHTSFLGLIHIWYVRGRNCSGRKLCSILPQKPSRIRFFSKKHVFGLNFCTKSHITYFPGQMD